MSRPALARRWRPRLFADLVGQNAVATALQNALAKNEPHHAYLFTGTRGVGKTTLARILATALNCEKRDPEAETGAPTEPCLECDFCRAIVAEKFPDVIEMDAASHTQVDKMREILESAAYAPLLGRAKVLIIDEVHMLGGGTSKGAFSAMLKTLEEPPSHLHFALATTERQKIPVTVLSRCLCFSLPPIAADAIAARVAAILEAEKIEFEPEATVEIARLARGSLRDALSILEQAVAYCGGNLTAVGARAMIGDAGVAPLAKILAAVAANDVAALHQIADDLTKASANFDVALEGVAGILFRASLARAKIPKPPSEGDDEWAAAQATAGLFSGEELQVLYEIALRGREQLTLAPDERCGFEMTLLRMALFAPEAAGAAPPPQSPPPQAKPSAPVVPESVPESAPVAAPESAAVNGAAASSPVAAPSWREMFARFSAGAKLIAEHCAVESESESGIDLVLDSNFESRLRHKDRLVSQIKQIRGAPFRVSLRVGRPAVATMAAQQQAATDERQDAAEKSILEDPTVRQIIADHPGARVLPESIRPHPSQETTEGART